MSELRIEYYNETRKEAKGEEYIKWLEGKLSNREVLIYSEYFKQGYDDDNQSSLDLVNKFDIDKYTLEKIKHGFTSFRCFQVIKELELKKESKLIYSLKSTNDE